MSRIAYVLVVMTAILVLVGKDNTHALSAQAVVLLGGCGHGGGRPGGAAGAGRLGRLGGPPPPRRGPPARRGPPGHRRAGALRRRAGSGDQAVAAAHAQARPCPDHRAAAERGAGHPAAAAVRAFEARGGGALRGRALGRTSPLGRANPAYRACGPEGALMTAENTPTPDGSGPVDWDRYETELGRDGPPTGTAPLDPDAAEATRVLVDSPEAQRPARPGLSGLRAAQRRPIVPAWARSRAELAEVCHWAVGFAAHTSGYHLARSPVYAGRLAARAPRGSARVLAGWLRWLFDLEAEPVRAATVRAQDAEAYLKLARQRDRRVRWRATVSTGLLAALGLAGMVLLLAPPLLRWAALVAMVATFGAAGRPADRPLLDRAVVVPKAPRLTSEMVVRALGVLGLAGINQALGKDAKAIEFVAPVTRDGPGWRAEVNLPPGVTVTEVIDRRDKLASGLARPLGCVWPEGNTEVHPGRLVLWVGDQDMAKARQGAWPLAKSGAVDLFRPFPFGTDQRGRPVPLTLMFASMVVGSIPRMGKTFAMRLALLAAALDVRAELHAYDLKGTGDFSVLEPVAHRYRAGDDQDDLAYALADLRELAADLAQRTKVIR